MIYYFDAMEQFTDGLCDQYIDRLPLERQQKVRRYKRLIDQKLSIISYLILQHGLRREYGIDEQVHFGYKDNHKPYLLDYPHIHFNISHCECCVAVAISCSEIGIDVQNMMDYDDKLASYVCSKQEMEQLTIADDPGILFIKYWTLKESYLKMKGTGVTDHMSNYDFSEASTPGFEQFNLRFHILHHPQYIMSTCSVEHHLIMQPLRLMDFTS
ncbi:4'-phosphopantetheinyl transferase family protein [Paenibacillus sp. NPDC058071]|uniref:4'-phosphopantetheinyl transferase family protein n=1 Tax=Paenibacillus sp. NPDC058071 TaxID=3346326 RepID=UPI0036DA701F